METLRNRLELDREGLASGIIFRRLGRARLIRKPDAAPIAILGEADAGQMGVGGDVIDDHQLVRLKKLPVD